MSMTVTVVLTGDDATWETAADQEKAVLGLFRDGSEPKVVRTQHRGGGLGFVVSTGEPPKRVRKPKAGKPQPDSSVPVDNPDIPAPGES